MYTCCAHTHERGDKVVLWASLLPPAREEEIGRNCPHCVSIEQHQQLDTSEEKKKKLTEENHVSDTANGGGSAASGGDPLIDTRSVLDQTLKPQTPPSSHSFLPSEEGKPQGFVFVVTTHKWPRAHPRCKQQLDYRAVAYTRNSCVHSEKGALLSLNAFYRFSCSRC